MKTYGGVHVHRHVFLASALAGGEWSASRPGGLTPGERLPHTNLMGGWLGPRTGLNDVERTKIWPLPRLENVIVGKGEHNYRSLSYNS
jgi:hypothetical protein